jgi:hypothetical protein|tara:strand:+ start:148 stop:300 length:153 start_codon:yes stop_codon:yes gene_type:complete
MNRHYIEYLDQKQKREKQLLCEILESFEAHKQRTLKDLAILKTNLEVKQK